MRHLATIYWLVLAAAWTAQAGEIRGKVENSHHDPIPGATVRIRENGLRVKSGADGTYRFENLPAGTYTISIDGFEKQTFAPISVAREAVSTVNLQVAAQDFFDEPKFTVAGVTTSPYSAGHGSDAGVRSAGDLAKATEALGHDATEKSLAREYEEQGKPVAAAREYQMAAEKQPNEANVFNWGAELLKHRAGRQAIDVFGKGAKLFPGSSRMLLGLAVANYSLGEQGEAERAFFAACDLHPADPKPYLFLGAVQDTGITRSEGFLERMARFAKLAPRDPQAQYLYAAALWQHREDPKDRATPARVVALTKQAVQLDPKMGAAYLLLGIVQADLGHTAEAIAALKQGAAASPDLPEPHYRLGQVYRKAGAWDQAKQESDIAESLSKNLTEQLQREQGELQRFVIALKTP